MEFVEEQGATIVANGSFNPSIFQPSWLARNDVIQSAEEEEAKVELIHPEISRFQVPGMAFDVQTERFVIHASAEPFVRISDIFQIIFQDKLSHTPITSGGINYWAHVRLNNWAQRQRFGRRLAPIEPWGHFGELLESKDRTKAGGFSTLVMRAAHDDYGSKGSITVTVQPSVKVSNDEGVFFNVNNHMGDQPDGYGTLVSEIVARFDDCISASRAIIDHMTKEGRSS